MNALRTCRDVVKVGVLLPREVALQLGKKAHVQRRLLPEELLFAEAEYVFQVIQNFVAVFADVFERYPSWRYADL